MALVWLSVGWALYDRRAALGFVALGLPFGLLPDTDLWLKRVFSTVKHHGVTHTVLFVSVAAVVIGAILGKWVVPWLQERYIPESDVGNRYTYAIGAVWVGGLSHIFADMLSAPDIAEAVEPFWPIYRQSLGIDVVWYNNPFFNWGLLLGGIALVALLWWTGDERGSRPQAEA